MASSVDNVNGPDVTPINENESEAGNGDSGHLEDLSNPTQLSDKDNEGDSGPRMIHP